MNSITNTCASDYVQNIERLFTQHYMSTAPESVGKQFL